MTATINPSYLAQLVNAYWARRGVDANARVEEGILISDLVNGMPRGRFDPRRLRELDKKKTVGERL